MDEQAQKLNALRVTYGALRAAKAAMESIQMHANPYADRIEQLAEEMRKLQRDIAREAGL
jgi:ribosomal protein L29